MCRHYDFAERWAERHRVTIIGSDAWEAKRITYDYPWVPDGVDLRSLHVPYDNSMSSRERLWAFASFARKARAAASAIRDADVVIGTSTPLSVGWAADRAAARLGVPFVFEIRDLWPDFPIEMGAIGSAQLRRWLLRREGDLYRAADHVVTLSPDMSTHVRNRGIDGSRVSTVLQGSDIRRASAARNEPATAELRRRHQLGDARIVLYAGAFGRANAIPTLLAAAQSLQSLSNILFVFVGHGYHTGTIERQARNSSNIRLLPPVPRHAIFDWFALASLSVVGFVDVPSVAASSPSKLFDSLAAGCPVIVTNPGWTKELVEENRCGWYTPAEDADSLSDLIAQLLRDPAGLQGVGRNGQRLAQQQFDRVQLADRFEDILAETVDRHTRRLQSN